MILKKEALLSSETSVAVYRSTRPKNPEEFSRRKAILIQTFYLVVKLSL
jgi:hypothetical protein